jgi:hypothetical protein
MGARHKARKRALDILFEADQRGQSIDVVLADRAARGDAAPNPYTATLVAGVIDHRAEIDALIEANAIDWTLDRMPAVDRSLLRLATFELRSPSTRPSNSPKSCRPTTLRRSSTAFWGGSRRPRPPDAETGTTTHSRARFEQPPLCMPGLRRVPREGLEPSCLSATDFESAASANSATGAGL